MAEYYRMKNRTYKGSDNRRNTDRNGKSSFRIIKDGKEYHYGPPCKMESDPILLDDFKRSTKCHGGYSEDKARNFSNDDSYVNFLNTDYLPDRYSTEKKVHFDLTVGEQEGKEYDGTPLQAFHNFLSWILSNDKEYKKLVATPAKSGGKFVFLKNILTKLFLAPYNHAQQITFYATCVNGIIYLMNSVNLTEFKMQDRQVSLRAHKFQQYLVSAGGLIDFGVSSHSMSFPFAAREWECWILRNFNLGKAFPGYGKTPSGENQIGAEWESYSKSFPLRVPYRIYNHRS